MGYKVFYMRNNSRSENRSAREWSVKEVKAPAQATTLGNLAKFTWYKIRVAAFNSKGVGPKATAIVLRTSEDGKNILLFWRDQHNINSH